MKKKYLLGIFIILVGLLGIIFVITNENTLVFHPKGIVAHNQLKLIITNIILMMLILVPTTVLLFVIVWKYCIKNKNRSYDPHHSFGPKGELLMWLLPSIIVAVMAAITWKATHKLDPYKPLESDVKPLKVQVVALNWKWLFIYPEQEIATLNYFYFPEKTPVHLNLAADHSPMNSFWIPQLSGQIYSMAGMTTQLHLMADGPGEYAGRAVEINGEGYADMTFLAKSVPEKDFETWVEKVKQSTHQLTEESYNQLTKPAVNKEVILFSKVQKDLFHKIVHKYMYPTHPVLWKNSSSEN